MREVTEAEVKEAVLAMHKSRIRDHSCLLCAGAVYYEVRDGMLFFNPNCKCTAGCVRDLEPRAWSELARTINMQVSEEAQANMLGRFNIPQEVEA